MPSLDDLKKRITSVKSTQKITKAMKMVAAAKLRKAQESAEKGRPYSEKMNNIILNGPTIPHEITTKVSGSKVLLKPAAPGTGVIAGGGVRAVLEAVGVTDVLSKTFGSSNTINIVRATLSALEQLRDPKIVISKRREG